MDTLRANFEHHFDQCLPSTKTQFKILMDSILEEADKVDAEQDFDTRIKGIKEVTFKANKVLKLDDDMKKLMSKK